MGPLAVTSGALAKITEGAFEDGQRCTLQVGEGPNALALALPSPTSSTV